MLRKDEDECKVMMAVSKKHMPMSVLGMLPKNGRRAVAGPRLMVVSR